MEIPPQLSFAFKIALHTVSLFIVACTVTLQNNKYQVNTSKYICTTRPTPFFLSGQNVILIILQKLHNAWQKKCKMYEISKMVF